MSQPNEFKAPKIEGPHFKSVVKKIRGDDNTFLTSICDIIDNIYGLACILKCLAICNIQIQYDEHGNLYKITISDNICHGFKSIFNTGVDNPLNMGHIRLGHENDDESSEFGTGLNTALIFLSQYSEIYTRSVSDETDGSAPIYVKIVFDIPTMLGRSVASESYEPTEFKIIDEKTFKEFHPYEEGSSIILSNLKPSDVMYRTDIGSRMTTQEFEEFLCEYLGEIYRGLIGKNIHIILNDKQVVAQHDLIELVPQANKMMCTFQVKTDSNNDPKEIYRKSVSGNRASYMKFDPITTKFKQTNKEAYDAFINQSYVYELVLHSLTTYNTPYVKIQHQDKTNIVRGGRDFGKIKLTKQEMDGYSNHIYHRINYTSKKLNPILGIGSNKRLHEKSNMLMTAIHVTEKERNTKFRNCCKTKEVHINDSDTDESVTKRVTKKKPDTPSSSKKKKISAADSKTDSKTGSESKSDTESITNSDFNFVVNLVKDQKEESTEGIIPEINNDNSGNIPGNTEEESVEMVIKEKDETPEEKEVCNCPLETRNENTVALDKIVSVSYTCWNDFWSQNKNLIMIFIQNVNKTK